MTRLEAGAATDVGRVRSSNQDSVLCGELLFAVADGMGGHAGGEVASRVALETLQESFDRSSLSLEDLVEAVEAANVAVWEQSVNDAELSGMGSTLTALALVDEDGEERLGVANVGDSRAYVLHDSLLSQLTLDHSVVEELVRRGEMTPDEAANNPRRHILTRAIGIEPEVDVDTVTIEALVGDRLLVCSDGLSNEVGDDEMASVLGRQPNPARAAQELVRLARAHGGSDNITVVVVDVLDGASAGKASAGRGRMAVAGAARQALPRTQPTPRAQGMALTQAMPAARAGAEPGAGAPGTRTPDRPRPGGGPGDRPLGTNTAGTVLAPRMSPPAPGQAGSRTARPAQTARASPPAQAAASPQPSSPPPVSRRMTLKVVVFLVLVVAVLGGAVGAVAWFADSSYYVGLSGQRVVIYQGRIGGLLWFRPHLAESTTLTTSSVLPSRLVDLRNGQQEPSLAVARRYVANLRQEATSLPTSPSTTSNPLSPGTTSNPLSPGT